MISKESARLEAYDYYTLHLPGGGQFTFCAPVSGSYEFEVQKIRVANEQMHQVRIRLIDAEYAAVKKESVWFSAPLRIGKKNA